jgi:hypothetical protein
MKKSLLLVLFGALFTLTAPAQTKMQPAGSVIEQTNSLTRQMMNDLELGEDKYIPLRDVNALHMANLTTNPDSDPAAENARYEAQLAEVLSPEQMEQYRSKQQSDTPN